MIINGVKINGYKNLKNIDLFFNPKMNILCGENAQGKTNLIESMWLCTGCKSFRGTRDKDFIGFDKEIAEIGLEFSTRERNKQKIDFCVEKRNPKEKKVLLNGVKLPFLSRLFGNLKCIIFTPDDLELTKGSPENRRIFTDLAISQIKPTYVQVLNKYDNILTQRNSLLKELSFGRGDETLLDIYDEQIAEAGDYISILRDAYTRKLNSYAGELYYDLTKGRETLEIKYNSTIFSHLDEKMDYKGEMKNEYISKLRSTRESDIKSGFTQVGVHRDDLITNINGIPSREYGSQGQSRSVALVMKLAQAQILFDELGEEPVILLDDVLSELDLSRQDFILNRIDNMQLFVTCCDATAVLRHKMGTIFFMRNGEVYDIINPYKIKMPDREVKEDY